MKRIIEKLVKKLGQVTILAIGLSAFLVPASIAAPLDLATIPLSNSPTVQIRPNLLFILDDSGSMESDFMPDYVNSYSATSYFSDANFNAVAYDPAIKYDPPANFDTNGLNNTKYPSQTGTSTTTGADFNAKPNWKSVKDDAYGIVSTGTANLQDMNSGNGPDFWVTIPGEYCTKSDLKICVAQSVPTVDYPYPAAFRWCNSLANAADPNPPAGSCQGLRQTGLGFKYLRAPTSTGSSVQSIAKLTITSASSTPIIESITVNGKEILSASTKGTTNNTSSIAFEIANRINICTQSVKNNCDVSGFSAFNSGSEVTIYAPSSITSTPALVVKNKSGSLSYTMTAFGPAPPIAGTRMQVFIKSSTNSYPYPGSATKAAMRRDCAGSVCTYAEEMTNYANWYTYYHTRSQMMKTSVSLAFKDIGDNFKIGFMTTSTLGDRSLNFAPFNTAQKAKWYSKLFSTKTDRWTPLRGALSTAGLIYANQENGHGAFSDPMEYECQQNFTLLTTDGFWNTNEETSTYAGSPRGLSNDSVIGNRDKTAPRPMYEGGTATNDRLADVAKYYNDKDLRTSALGNCSGALGSSVCGESTSGTGTPPNLKQNMVTYTLGLGVDGELIYERYYNKLKSGDFYDISQGTKDWTVPVEGEETAIDDLWHAAVNGDGLYFSAKNPTDVVSQLKEALASIAIKEGTGAAAATSTLNPVTGDNYAYVASYTSGNWIGNLEKRQIDTTTGEVQKNALTCVEDVVSASSCASPSTIKANGSGGYDCVTSGATSCVGGTLVGTDCKVPVATSCNGSLKSKVSDFSSASRKILMNNGGGTLVDFNYSNLISLSKLPTNYSSSFLPANLSQWSTLTPAQQANVTSDHLVAYLRGETGYEQSASVVDNQVFRSRQATLGDLIDSKPIFVGKPVFNYGDPGYQSFKSSNSARQGVVYVGSNDGMLHAFNGNTLEELWAFVPSMVMPNMWKLADFDYSSKHSYFVDGDIVINDICVSGCTGSGAVWKTILVSGLRAGGRGYFAIDITSPTNPKLLWEFDASSAHGDSNLGFTFGNPIITKRHSDDKWVVLFTSGYNNIPDNDTFYSLTTTQFKPNNPALYTGGDGNGYLYVIDAYSGSKLGSPIQVTLPGSQSNPIGLSKIKAYIDDAEVNHVTQFVYGGDLQGNLWKFDIDAATATQFAKLQASGVDQPITTSPELGDVNGKTVVFVGTGKYLEVSDLIDNSKQTLYAIKDDASTPLPFNNPRSSLVQQTVVANGANDRKSGSANSVNFDTQLGWYVDFPDSGERQNIASRLVLGTLLVPTTVPTSSACQPAGYGWFNYFDYKTGLAVNAPNSSGLVSQRTSAPSVGFNVVYIDGQPKVSNLVADNKDPVLLGNVPFAGSATGFQVQRSIWREIIE